MTVTLWRIATDTRAYAADDLSGAGAKLTGGRWNDKGTAMVYTSSNRALACLETLVHLKATALPLNRYLVELSVPDDIWVGAEELTQATAAVGWDAIPAGLVSVDYGTEWASANRSAMLRVPSVIIPEEHNVLINPSHPDALRISARKVRKWNYDPAVRGSARR